MIRSVLFSIFLLVSLYNTCLALDTADILGRAQQRYAEGNFEADFVQESHLKAMGMVDTAKGHLYFGPPGKMRWHYKTPEEYFIITDGVAVWIFRPEENQVILGRAADYFGGRNGTDFFTKPGELSKEFIVEQASKELHEEGLYVLRLVPRTERPDIVELYLSISKESFNIVRAVTYNAFGDMTVLMFHGYTFGRELNRSLFVFEIPNGADVVPLQGK